MLEDGTYDVFVVDATPVDGDSDSDSGGSAGAWRLELTVVAGERKGEVVTVAARGLAGTEFDLIGMPGTLTVSDGAPAFAVDH